MFCEQWLKLKRVVEMDCETLNKAVKNQPENIRAKYRSEVYNQLLRSMNRLEEDIKNII